MDSGCEKETPKPGIQKKANISGYPVGYECIKLHYFSSYCSGIVFVFFHRLRFKRQQSNNSIRFEIANAL